MKKLFFVLCLVFFSSQSIAIPSTVSTATNIPCKDNPVIVVETLISQDITLTCYYEQLESLRDNFLHMKPGPCSGDVPTDVNFITDLLGEIEAVEFTCPQPENHFIYFFTVYDYTDGYYRLYI